MVDRLRQRRINEAAEQLTSSLADSYRAAVERGASAQRLHAELMQQLAELSREQREAFLELSRESGNAYAGFLESLFSYYRTGVGEAQDNVGDLEPTEKGPTPEAVEFMARFIDKYDEAFRNLATR